jgi:GNAT superfamily N-acetyltransferase/ribosomal protein S18 acetylase RimI-like enzyme
MMKPAFILRPMEQGDVTSAMKLSNAEGWNQTENDWRLFLEDPGNVAVVAECDKKVVGTTTTINYSNQVVWVGMVLVDKEYRGWGISKELLNNIFKNIEPGKSIKLDATPAGQPVYKKLGFEDEYQVARMINLSVSNLSQQVSNDIIPETGDISNIIKLDEISFGTNREQLMKYLVREYPRKAWLLKRDDHTDGFILGREGSKYHHIGPLMATNPEDAKILISKSLNDLINKPVVVDVPSDKKELIEWLTSIGFVTQRFFTRMYKDNNNFPGRTDNQYLVTGPEFG